MHVLLTDRFSGWNFFRVWGWALLIPALFAGSASAQKKGKIVFRESLHNFGSVKEELGLAEKIFVFDNTGSAPVSVMRVQTTCGCTSPEWTEEPVPPGSSGFVKVIFNPTNRPGPFNKKVTVISDGVPAQKTLTVYGKVYPRVKGPKDFYPFKEGNLRFRTNHLTYGKIENDELKIRETEIYNDGAVPVRFSIAKSKLPQHIKVELDSNVIMPEQTMLMKVTFNAARKYDYGFVFDNFLLATNDKDKPYKKVAVSADIIEKLDKSVSALREAPKAVFSRKSHDFGRVLEGDELETFIELRNDGKSTLIIRKIDTPCGCTRVTAENVVLNPGEKTNLRIQVNTKGRVGAFRKSAAIITNDPTHQQTSLVIKARIDSRE